MDDATRNVLMAYHDVVNSGSGRIVMADLQSSFVDRQNEALAEELAEIPHPFREYVYRGLTMAVQKIEGAAALCAHYLEVGFPTQEDIDDA